MIYHVCYVEDCGSKRKSFRTVSARKQWIADFLLQNQCNEDSWIDLIFNGSIEYAQYDEQGHSIRHRNNGS